MEPNPIVSAWLKGERPEDVSPEQWRAIGLIVAGAATEEHFEAAGQAFCNAVKADESLLRRSHSMEGAQEKADSEEGVIRWILSAESVDRAGDIIRQSGWNLKAYKQNPVVLFAHEHRSEPIGRAENLSVETIKNVPALVGDIRFAINESEDAARLFRLASGKYLKAGSVGFRPLKTTIPNSDEERGKLGLGRWGVLFDKSELLEFSLVTVPAHPQALQRALKEGELSPDDAQWASALSDPTEKEWEKLMRERARSFVDMGKADGDGADHVPDTITNDETTDDGPTDNMRDFIRELWAPEENAKALAALASSQERQADALESLARSITDLATCLGVERKAIAQRSTEAVKQDSEADLRKTLETLREELSRHLNPKDR